MTFTPKKYIIDKYVGDQFNSWIVLGFDRVDKKGQPFWLCRCICGQERTIRASSLFNGRSKSCNTGTCHPRVRYNTGIYEASLCFPGWAYSRLSREAKFRGLELSVSQDYLAELLENQQFLCALSNIPIHYEDMGSKLTRSTASLDRIDSSKGYVLGNLQFLHKHINKMKLDHSETDFIQLCSRVHLHQQQQLNSCNNMTTL